MSRPVALVTGGSSGIGESYPVGKGARMITTSRDLLPDRVFDEVVSRTFGTR